jgi:eukaryotic-like serine/threonine-protein kinase
MSVSSLKELLLDPATWQQVSSHLDRLLELESAEREPALRELAAIDTATADLLNRLLAKPQAANEYLEHSSFVLFGLPLPPRSMAGVQIGGYTIERLIARGGMGAVWLACRTDGKFEGRCAIKFVEAFATRTDLAERFAKEGRLLARLGHPNIARLLDAGTTSDGRPFLVLEYVDGERIDRYCDSRQLSVEARVRLFLDAVSAVAHAHSQLVIHRDLKPSNMLVGRDGSVKLLDFGIAKLLSNDERDPGTQTRIEESALTPDYAAPEQLLGDAPSTATDVYQLGMLLYVLLTGRSPLPSAASRAERIKASLDKRLPLASESCDPPLRNQLRGDLDAILAKALDIAPALRYPTAAALHDELVRYLNHVPVSVRGDNRLYLVGKFVARHRLIVGVTTTALVALCATLTFAIEQARSAAIERDRAVAFASRNEAVTEFLGRVITDGAASPTPLTVSELLARSEKLALSDASGSPENRAAVLGMIASRYAATDNLARAEPLLARALQLLDDSSDLALRSRLICEHAAVNAGTQLWHTEPALRVLYAEIARLGAAEPRPASHCLHYAALIHLTEHRANEALRDAQLGLEKSRQAGVGVIEATLLGTMAYAHHLNGHGAEAERYFEQALRKFREMGREQSDDALVVLANWAASMHTAGVPRRALELMEQTEHIERQRGGDVDPTATVLGNRGFALEALGRFDQARAAFDQECQLAASHSDPFSEIHCVTGLATVSLQTSKLDRAEQELERLSRLVANADLPAESHWVRMHALLSGGLELARDRPTQAHAAFQRTLIIDGEDRTSLRAHLGQSAAALATGTSAQAIDSARRALSIATRLQGDLPHSLHTGLASLALGRALLQAGEHTEARKFIALAVTHLASTVDADHPALRQARTELREPAPAPAVR